MKKIIISTSILKPALEKLGHAISNKSVLPVLNNLLCKVDGKELEMIASNAEVTIHLTVEVESTENFEFLLPYSFISKIVAFNKNCPLEIESAKKLKIAGPSDVYEFKVGETVDDWPKPQAITGKNIFEVNSDILHCLRVALITTGNDELRPKFQHVLLELSKDKITVASTDGSFCVFSKEFAAEHKLEGELLLSQRLIKVLDGAEAAKVSFSEKAIRFEAGNMVVYNTRSTEKYANFRAIFPAVEPNLVISKTVFADAILRCALADDDLKAANIDLQKKGLLNFTASDAVVKINVEAAAEYTGSVKKIAINHEKCMKVLNQIGGDEITLAVHDANRGIVFTCNGDEGYKGLLMPIIVTE